jgi:hypothetical protein
MMDNVTLMPGGSVPGDDVSTDVVAALEEALGEARSGKLVGVAIAKVYALQEEANVVDISHSWAWGRDFHTSRLIGCIQVLLHELAYRTLNGRLPSED